MKIKEIKAEGWIFEVTFKPNFIERLFGVKEKTKRFKRTWSFYTFGGGNVYINERGEKLGNGNWIGNELDAFQRKF